MPIRASSVAVDGGDRSDTLRFLASGAAWNVLLFTLLGTAWFVVTPECLR